jgi:hypothetical protein
MIFYVNKPASMPVAPGVMPCVRLNISELGGPWNGWNADDLAAWLLTQIPEHGPWAMDLNGYGKFWIQPRLAQPDDLVKCYELGYVPTGLCAKNDPIYAPPIENIDQAYKTKVPQAHILAVIGESLTIAQKWPDVIWHDEINQSAEGIGQAIVDRIISRKGYQYYAPLTTHANAQRWSADDFNQTGTRMVYQSLTRDLRHYGVAIAETQIITPYGGTRPGFGCSWPIRDGNGVPANIPNWTGTPCAYLWVAYNRSTELPAMFAQAVDVIHSAPDGIHKINVAPGGCPPHIVEKLILHARAAGSSLFLWWGGTDPDTENAQAPMYATAVQRALETPITQADPTSLAPVQQGQPVTTGSVTTDLNFTTDT